jgi:cell division septal protein FtsQ
MPEKKDKNIEEMLRKLGKQDVEYSRLNKRRESFIRQMFINKYFWLILLVLFIVFLCIFFPDLLPVLFSLLG